MVADPERPPPEPGPNDARLPQSSAASAPPPAEPLAQRLVMLKATKNTATKLSIRTFFVLTKGVDKSISWRFGVSKGPGGAYECFPSKFHWIWFSYILEGPLFDILSYMTRWLSGYSIAIWLCGYMYSEYSGSKTWGQPPWRQGAGAKTPHKRFHVSSCFYSELPSR